MKYTSLFLDLDNTLLDFYKAESMAVKKILKENNLPTDDKTIKTYSTINLSFWERFERGEIKKSEIFEGRFIELLKVLNKKRDYKRMSDNYCIALSDGSFTIAHAPEICKYFKDKGYLLYATTNGNCKTQYKRIKNSGLDEFFSDIFVSEEIGYQKPDKAYFDNCIKRIPEKNKNNIIIIGDSQTSDILGGINSGIDTCWFNPFNLTPKYKSTFEIKNLNELKNIL